MNRLNVPHIKRHQVHTAGWYASASAYSCQRAIALGLLVVGRTSISSCGKQCFATGSVRLTVGYATTWRKQARVRFYFRYIYFLHLVPFSISYKILLNPTKISVWIQLLTCSSIFTRGSWSKTCKCKFKSIISE